MLDGGSVVVRVPVGGARRRLEADPVCTDTDAGPVWDALVAEAAAYGRAVTSCADVRPFCEPEPAVRASCMRSCGACPPAAADDEDAEVAGFKVTVHARFAHQSLHSTLSLAHFHPVPSISALRGAGRDRRRISLPGIRGGARCHAAIDGLRAERDLCDFRTDRHGRGSHFVFSWVPLFFHERSLPAHEALGAG